MLYALHAILCVTYCACYLLYLLYAYYILHVLYTLHAILCVTTVTYCTCYSLHLLYNIHVIYYTCSNVYICYILLRILARPACDRPCNSNRDRVTHQNGQFGHSPSGNSIFFGSLTHHNYIISSFLNTFPTLRRPKKKPEFLPQFPLLIKCKTFLPTPLFLPVLLSL